MLLTPYSQHPQPSLPHMIAAGESACWMMTGDQIREALIGNEFGLPVDVNSAVLRPFAKANGERVEAAETTNLSDW